MTYADNVAHFRLIHIAQSAQSTHAQIENAHACTLVLRRKQGSLRVNGVTGALRLEAAQGSERGREKDGAVEQKREEEELGSVGIHMRIRVEGRKYVIAAGR